MKTSLLDNTRRKNARLVVRDRGIDRGENVTEKASCDNRELSSRL